MKRFTIPVLVAGLCSLAIALPQSQDGQGSFLGAGLSGPKHSVRKPAPPPELASPIVHQGIPGESIVDGVYVERSVTGQDRVYDLSLGAQPVLPVDRSAGGGGSYQGGCPCPTDARAEVEPNCGLNPNGSADPSSDFVNGGCNSSPEVFGTIELGDVICGTAAWDLNGMGYRDVDWYESVLTTTTTVTFSMRAEFATAVFIVDGNAGCGGSFTIASDVGSGCADPATVSVTLAAGTYWFVAAPEVGQPSIPCGTTYTAILTEGCELYASEAAFDAANPGLTVEDFEDFAVLPGAFCGPELTPWDSNTANACVSPGDITPGLEIDSISSSAAFVVGIGYAGTGNPVDSNQVLPPPYGPTSELRFDPPVRSIGLELELLFPGAGVVAVELEDSSGELIALTTASIADSTETFWGVACDEPIATLRIIDGTGLLAAYGSVRYGGTGGCEFITNESQFDARFPGLTLEDFEGTAVPALGYCTDSGPWDSTTSNTCILPGEIEEGLTLDTVPGGGYLAVVALGYGGAVESDCVIGNGLVTMDLFFDPPVTRVGMDLEGVFGESGTSVIEVYDPSGTLISSAGVAVGTSQTFIGVACDELIGQVRVVVDTVLHTVDNVRYGTSMLPYTRFCVEESVGSVNTGLKTIMVLESQTGGGALLPFDKSISGNAAPNRFMMIAKDAPGPGNGGVTNIGYFIMGTGASTFVPPGSAGPICVAPGIKRYIGPVNITNETITFHDAGGTPTTLVGQGFSRAALGAGAHFVGTNIGGSSGFHWSFQAWHRDTPGLTNLSDAIAVDFTP